MHFGTGIRIDFDDDLDSVEVSSVMEASCDREAVGTKENVKKLGVKVLDPRLREAESFESDLEKVRDP